MDLGKSYYPPGSKTSSKTIFRRCANTKIKHGITKQLYGLCMETETYRAMLDYIKPGCYVESENTGQHGTVSKVIRSCNGVPVCVRVNVDDRRVDFISVDRITLFEPYDAWCDCLSSYSDDAINGYENWFKKNGYEWSNEKGCYINKDTGDEMVY